MVALKNYSFVLSALCCLMLLSLNSCLSDGINTIILDNGGKTGIPSDSQATPNPSIGNSTTSIPNVQHTDEEENGYYIIRLDMTGIQNPYTYEYLRLVGTGGENGLKQNVWLSVDDIPKGISVYNTIDDYSELPEVKNDVVFLVDNSGSMSQEADVIARDIISWAQKLTADKNVRFGCVGYDGLIGGAIDLTDYNEVSKWLNRSTGISRTMGFAGSNASRLNSAASRYSLSSQNESGVAALRFADENFTFRSGSNRVYVNFTDEENYTGGYSYYSVSYVNNQNNWNTSKGTIHTVFSAAKSSVTKEQPWLLSQYTGGTILYASSDFSGITLDSLPITSAIQCSYIIRFIISDELMDGLSHKVKITVRSEDGSVRAEKTIHMVFGTV